MSAVSQLISVKYTDLTNYTAGAGNDVLGVPFDHHWGPVGVLNTLSQSAFFQNYPESLPIGKTSIVPTRYYAYAQAKKALEMPNVLVEAFRVQGGWKYAEIYLSKEITEAAPQAYSVVQNVKQFASISDKAMAISLKYPGIPPKSLLGDYDRLAIVISANKDDQSVIIKVCGATKAAARPETGLFLQEDSVYFQVDESTPVEEWQGSTNPSAMLDGASYFIEDVVASSDFIAVSVNSEFQIPENILPTAIHLLQGVAIPEAPSQEQWEAALQVFDDTLNSEATLLISPVATADLDNKVLQLAASRQDMNGVIGYPVNEVFDKDSIETFLTTMAGVRNMFSFFVVGREMYKIFGYKIQLNCVGGWCGATINIAQTVRTNQLASAFTYGGYNGTLTETLSFDDVCELHKLGVISVFSSNQGPMIWGVRSLHTRQTSYFGAANVIRVLSKILRQVFPECLNAIHTDAAANPITRANFNIKFNGIINDEISQQNLLSDSKADCLGEVNSDVNTKGGRIFNLNLVLHFIGLVEAINIHVFATDSSVTAKIS